VKTASTCICSMEVVRCGGDESWRGLERVMMCVLRRHLTWSQVPRRYSVRCARTSKASSVFARHYNNISKKLLLLPTSSVQDRHMQLHAHHHIRHLLLGKTLMISTTRPCTCSASSHPALKQELITAVLQYRIGWKCNPEQRNRHSCFTE
jgi:hypothetical protein